MGYRGTFQPARFWPAARYAAIEILRNGTPLKPLYFPINGNNQFYFTTIADIFQPAYLYNSFADEQLNTNYYDNNLIYDVPPRPSQYSCFDQCGSSFLPFGITGCILDLSGKPVPYYNFTMARSERDTTGFGGVSVTTDAYGVFVANYCQPVTISNYTVSVSNIYAFIPPGAYELISNAGCNDGGRGFVEYSPGTDPNDAPTYYTLRLDLGDIVTSPYASCNRTSP